MIAVTEEEMAKAPNKTERIAKGKFKGQMLAGLAVSHQLHCLNGLRMSLYPERYPDHAVWMPNGSLNTEMWTHHGA